MIFYSDTVTKYQDIKQEGLILPDNVTQREGIACGDAIDLSGEINNNIVRFHIISKGCILSRAACNFLYVHLSGLDVRDAYAECLAMAEKGRENRDNFLKSWGLQGRYDLFECLFSPVQVLRDFLRTMTTSPEMSYLRSDSLSNLDCDACVSSARINWNGKAENNIQPTPPRKYPTDYRRKWGIASKAYLNTEEKESLPILYSHMKDDDFDFLVHEKMLWAVYSNFEKNRVPIDHDQRFKEIAYPLHRQYVVKREISVVKGFINRNAIRSYFVKGARSAALYPKDFYRIHLDYDLICTDEESAFRLCNYLYDRGFRMFSGVFSLKWIDEDGRKVCSGHFHMQKILDAQFRLVIDISFPAFPMGRISLFHPEIKDNEIRAEDLFLVTMCHAFKHRNVFMKDINDVYMMTRKFDMDSLYLRKRIMQCGLEDEASLLLSYILRNFDIPEAAYKDLNLNLGICHDYPDWPYNEQSVYNIKRDNLDQRLLRGNDYPRTYLFPIFVTRALIDLQQARRVLGGGATVEDYSTSILRILLGRIEFYLFPMGLFMDSDFPVSNFGREAVRFAAQNILRLLGNPEYYELPYAIRQRDNWYD